MMSSSHGEIGRGEREKSQKLGSNSSREIPKRGRRLEKVTDTGDTTQYLLPQRTPQASLVALVKVSAVFYSSLLFFLLYYLPM